MRVCPITQSSLPIKTESRKGGMREKIAEAEAQATMEKEIESGSAS